MIIDITTDINVRGLYHLLIRRALDKYHPWFGTVGLPCMSEKETIQAYTDQSKCNEKYIRCVSSINSLLKELYYEQED